MSSVAIDDLTTRARLRDTAIAVFVRDGFGATVRTIASSAGVSAALIIHHFGSKAGLRAECDQHVLRTIRELKIDAVRSDYAATDIDGIGGLLRGIDGRHVVYLIRSLQDSGAVARDILRHLVADAEDTIRIGVEAGTIRPSLDEAARARHLVAQSIGALLVDIAMYPPSDWADADAILRDYLDRTLLPASEIAVQGILTDDSLLARVVAYRAESSGDSSREGERHAEP